ncbi:MAG: hypothetical protein P4L83_23150 [Nevskia sp.]|nr:hypothetical protein [Nevskia sp.]
MHTPPSIAAVADRALARAEHFLRWAFGAVLLMRLLFPYFDSPLHHLFSDPGRHWENGQRLLHPTFMGSSDPILYQVWLFLLQQIKGDVNAVVPAGCGFLCAAMPYGWYRAFKELLPRSWALGGALLMGLVPGFLGIYAYFMSETLLLSLTGFAFWATFRAMRKRSVAAFAVACALWLACGFTRSVALPMALVCLLCLWLPQPGKLPKALIGSAMLLAVAVPAGYHAKLNLHFFSPLGNSYLNEIYQASGRKVINLDFGPNGRYEFGSPSFYNPTFYPFSDWTTDRDGTVSVVVDLSKGREQWLSEKARVQSIRTFPRIRGYWESFLYVSFGQAWPDNDRGSLSGWLTVWTRWLYPPLILAVAVGALRRRFRGREWLLPACGLGLFLYFIIQGNGVMEARYRKPVDPLFIAAAVLMAHRRASQRGIQPVPVPA